MSEVKLPCKVASAKVWRGGRLVTGECDSATWDFIPRVSDGVRIALSNADLRVLPLAGAVVGGALPSLCAVVALCGVAGSCWV